MPSQLDLSSTSLAEVARALAEQRLPPVEQWQPAHCGNSEMRIGRDGRWFHQGSPINRPEMVRLFSSILRRESGGGYVLVTPAEKLDIVVEDAPFLAVEMKSEHEGRERTLGFRLNTGDLVIAGAAHPLALVGQGEAARPYLQVRTGLDAALARPVYYELAELALAEGGERPGVWSSGTFFALSR